MIKSVGRTGLITFFMDWKFLFYFKKTLSFTKLTNFYVMIEYRCYSLRKRDVKYQVESANEDWFEI